MHHALAMRLAAASMALVLSATSFASAQSAPPAPAPSGTWSAYPSTRESDVPAAAFDRYAYVDITMTGGSATLEANIHGSWQTICEAPSCGGIPLEPTGVYRINGGGLHSDDLRLAPGLRHLEVHGGSGARRGGGAILMAAAPLLHFAAFLTAVSVSVDSDSNGCETGGSSKTTGQCPDRSVPLALFIAGFASLIAGIAIFHDSSTDVRVDGNEIGSIDPMRFVF